MANVHQHYHQAEVYAMANLKHNIITCPHLLIMAHTCHRIHLRCQSKRLNKSKTILCEVYSAHPLLVDEKRQSTTMKQSTTMQQ